MVLPTKEFLTAISQIQDTVTKANIQSSLSNTLEQLPNSAQISELLKQLKIATSRQDVRRINEIGNTINQLINTDQQTKDQMNLLYQAVDEALPSAGVVNPFERAAGGTAPTTPQGQAKAGAKSVAKASAEAKITPPFLKAAQGEPSTPSSAPKSALELSPQLILELQDIFQPTQDVINRYSSVPQGEKKKKNIDIAKDIIENYINPIQAILKKGGFNLSYSTKYQDQPELQMKAGKQSGLPDTLKGLERLNSLYIEPLFSRNVVPQLALPPPVKGKFPQAEFGISPEQLALAEAGGGKQAGGAKAPTGKGIRGRGLSRKPKAIKINPEGGIKPQDEYVSLGRYVINKHKLNKNIVSIRTKTGHSAKLPVRRVSDSMSAVVKTILGGGMPSFDALEKLTDDEKNYLHKLSKQSNIIDKLSIPTPNKSQLDKDINEFEIMKGQIMNGNDNNEYIKKFKLLLMKLINQDVLPRNQGKEILIDLASLGY
jgi:hypothetical protein